MLNHKLTDPNSGADVREVARVQTLNTLENLDADRNKIVLRFLQGANLIKNAVINLSNADLSNDDLSGTDLRGIDLNGANLTGAHLNGADLSGATLYNATLGHADLSGAKLDSAFLFDAGLNGADLSDAAMNNTTLTGAFLGDANMNHAALTGARLNGVVLTGAHLNGADLNGADLNGADLNGANLNGANLNGADLSDANLVTAGLTPQQSGLTQQQLDTVSSCTNAALSKGLVCRHDVTINLTYWYTENSTEASVIKALVQEFEQNNPRIHINPVNVNYYQTETAFANAAAENKAPDVLRSDVGWVAQFASKGYLLSIDPYISQNDNLLDYLNDSLSYDYYKKQYYGLPQVTDFLELLYNKEELKKAIGTTSPPSNIHIFEDDAKKVIQAIPGTYGFETDGTAYNALPFLYAFGGGMFDQHNNPEVSSKESVNGLEFLLKLQNIDKVTPKPVNFVNSTPSPIVTDFAAGRTAMIFSGPYNVRQILAGSSFKNKPGNLGIAPIPGCPPHTLGCRAGQTGSPSGGQSYVISAGTTHPIEAYKFISFMSSPASQVKIAEANGTLPTRKSAYNNKAVSSNAIISAFGKATSTARDRPATPQAGHLFDAFDPNIAAALDGVESPSAGRSQAIEAIQAGGISAS